VDAPTPLFLKKINGITEFPSYGTVVPNNVVAQFIPPFYKRAGFTHVPCRGNCRKTPIFVGVEPLGSPREIQEIVCLTILILLLNPSDTRVCSCSMNQTTTIVE